MKKLLRKIKIILHHNPNDEWYDERKHLNEASEEIVELVKKAFDAGYSLGEFEASTVDWNRSKNIPQETKFKNFDQWCNGKL